MAYYDPYYQDPYYQDPYGGYDPYGYYQPDDAPPPEPIEEWVDVPKANRLYVKKINKDVIQEDFNHLKSDNLFSIEAMVDHIELNEELVVKADTNEKLDNTVVTSLKVFNLPFSELPLYRDDGKQNTVISEKPSGNSGKKNTVISEKPSRHAGKRKSVISEKSSGNSGKRKSVNSGKSGHSGKKNTVSSGKTSGSSGKKNTVIAEKPSGNPGKKNTVISEKPSGNSGKKNTVISEKSSKNNGKRNTVISEAPSGDDDKDNTVISEKSTSSNAEKQNTVISERSAATLPTTTSPAWSEYFQTLLSRLVKIAGKYRKEPETEEVKEDAGEEDGTEEKSYEGTPYATPTETPYEQIEEEPTNRVTIDVKGGKGVVLLATGFSMIQKLQTQDVRVTVDRRDVIETEYGEVTEVVPLGYAVVKLTLDFPQAVLRREATEGHFSVPLVDEQGTEVGKVDMSVTLLSLGQGVEVEMAEDPRAYGKVKLIDTFSPETVQSIFDPPVHPRLAVTLLNMEPPLGLNRTSTEIINAFLYSKLSPEDEEGSLYLKCKPRKCRWLEKARERSLSSQLSLSSIGSVTSKSNRGSFVGLRLPGKSDPELDLLWGKHKIKCKELWEEAVEMENKKRSLYEELDELLLQDKGDGWEEEDKEDKTPSETSAPSQEEGEEDQTSETSNGSDRKSTTTPTVQYD